MNALRQPLIKLRSIGRILWVRVAVIAGLTLLAALAAPLFDPLLPDALTDRFSKDAVLPVLSILASSMLAVATFSLGVMVSSHRTLAGNTTPRIHQLLMEDTSTQSTIATFIGAFVFSLFSIILFRGDYYSSEATIVVFAATVFVVLSIVVSLIRWIHKLSRIGSVEYALERAEQTARETLYEYRKFPTLGAETLDSFDDVPSEAEAVEASASGFLKFIDIADLGDLAQESTGKIYVLVHPGDRILKGQTVAKITGAMDKGSVAQAFSIGPARSHEQDPRYALQALRETASRALSPGINDPGTAIEVITRLEILWHDFLLAGSASNEPQTEGVYVCPLSVGALVETSFREIARDGAGFLEVLGALIHALEMLKDKRVDAVTSAVDDIVTALKEHATENLRTAVEKQELDRALNRLA